ncbi:MAG: PQQ-like beta-propeller repeat protein [Verrucomicrobiales bacterium]|nr:PQQ-like beta-propeller repeat protein [Verrucomicrobiales bacterium]
MRSSFFSAAIILFSFSGLNQSGASDWPQWRGESRDGSVNRESAFPNSLSEKNLKKLWSVELAEGYSSPVSKDGRVFTFSTRQKKEEVARAFNVLTGDEIWSREWAASMKVPFFAAKNGSWVRCTPSLAGGFVYFGGIRDELVKLNAETGDEAWRVDFKERHGTKVPTFGYVSSPLVADGGIYIQAGCAVTKLDAETGDELWRVMENRQAMFESAFSSPVLATIHGEKQLVVQTRTTLAGLNPETGDAIWSIAVKAFRGMNILTPTVIGNRIFTASYGGGSFLYEVKKTDAGQTVEQAWAIPTLEGYMASPLVIDDHIYLPGRDQHLHCIAVEDGTVKWKSEEKFGQYWSMIRKDNRILALDQTGELILFDANPEKFEILDRGMVSDQSTWAHIGISGDVLLVRGLRSLTAYSWK